MFINPDILGYPNRIEVWNQINKLNPESYMQVLQEYADVIMEPKIVIEFGNIPFGFETCFVKLEQCLKRFAPL